MINTLSSKSIQTEKAKFSHFDRTRGDKNQIFRTLESGYRSAMVGFLLSEIPGDYDKKKQYRDDALKFAKAALKFEMILPKEFVDPAKLKKNIEKLEKLFEFTTL